MLRISFLFPSLGNDWIGGVNYFRSLFSAFRSAGNLVPVIVVPPGLEEKARDIFPGCDIRTTPLIQKWSFFYLARKVIAKIVGKDVLLERFLTGQKIDILSHFSGVGRLSRIPQIGWIPDFQHLHLPQFFEGEEVESRTQSDRQLLQDCTQLIVSSEMAASDAKQAYPEFADKIRIMHFSPAIEQVEIVDPEILMKQYGFSGRYIFFPSQAWAHKNHLIAIRAVVELKKLGHEVQIICTGSLDDRRAPAHRELLMDAISGGDVSGNFRMLGIVPYSHMLSLMFHSHAFLNASLFEGWSTTVEEAKILNCRLILSDIPVHREQALANASYFDPVSPDSCAKAIWESWNEESKKPNPEFRVSSLVGLKAVEKRYLEIATEAIEGRK